MVIFIFPPYKITTAKLERPIHFYYFYSFPFMICFYSLSLLYLFLAILTTLPLSICRQPTLANYLSPNSELTPPSSLYTDRPIRRPLCKRFSNLVPVMIFFFVFFSLYLIPYILYPLPSPSLYPLYPCCLLFFLLNNDFDDE